MRAGDVRWTSSRRPGSREHAHAAPAARLRRSRLVRAGWEATCQITSGPRPPASDAVQFHLLWRLPQRRACRKQWPFLLRQTRMTCSSSVVERRKSKHASGAVAVPVSAFQPTLMRPLSCTRDYNNQPTPEPALYTSEPDATTAGTAAHPPQNLQVRRVK